jgi:hypothetical protein
MHHNTSVIVGVVQQLEHTRKGEPLNKINTLKKKGKRKKA